MDKFDKITKIKFSIFILYCFSFFVPIYSQTIWGSTFKVSISELNAGTFFVVFFFVLITASIKISDIFLAPSLGRINSLFNLFK